MINEWMHCWLGFRRWKGVSDHSHQRWRRLGFKRVSIESTFWKFWYLFLYVFLLNLSLNSLFKLFQLSTLNSLSLPLKAQSFECLGSVRKSGFLSVKKWLLRKKHSLELARKRGWKGFVVDLSPLLCSPFLCSFHFHLQFVSFLLQFIQRFNALQKRVF
jgi:hypothetical protein